ncbi:MAG: hypothetical protein ACR2LR_19055 [Hassallia sp.]
MENKNDSTSEVNKNDSTSERNKNMSTTHSEQVPIFGLGQTTISILLSKIVVLFILTGIVSYFFIEEQTQQYEKGLTLTKELYIKQYEEYRHKLLEREEYVNVNKSVLTTFLAMSFLITSYELTIFIISFIIKKIIKIG